MTTMTVLYGGIEAGGTKFICTVATSPTAEPIATNKIDTTTPAETLAQVRAFFQPHALTALGIGSFGPIDPRPDSPTYGYITATPKPGWQNTPLVPYFQEAFSVPIGFDTDVNAAALAEVRYGAAQGLSSAIYITVGTGIGGGAVINGEMLHGLLHPEMGHVPVPRHPHDTYVGHCPYHADCLEGMACGPAIEARWGVPASKLPTDHEAWAFEAYYLARAITAMIYTLSAERIILGGGVMHQTQLFAPICTNVVEMLNGYIQSATILQHSDTFIVPPGLGDRAGAIGALELAQRAAERHAATA